MTGLPLAARIEGAMWGLLVGDALGVPYEFHSRDEIPSAELIELQPPEGFRRAHDGTPPGTWSDDGAHALCMLASLLQHGRLDTDDLMRRLVNWYEHGYLAVEGRVFDVGVQTGRALSAFRAGTPALEAGPRSEHDNGNGALMRVLPLALWHRGSDAELLADAAKQSLITHGHLRSQLCCGLYCLWVRQTLAGSADAWSDAVARLRLQLGEETPQRAELEFFIRPDELSGGRGSGYVVDCLQSAQWALRQGSYEQVVQAAVSLGNDTDTTAAIAGGVAGARDGLQAIPRRWIEGLRGREDAAPLVERLVAAVG